MTKREILGHLNELVDAIADKHCSNNAGQPEWQRGYNMSEADKAREYLDAVRAYLGIDAREME